ncbi:MAG: hypothetical protein M3N98_06490 [Actinomycetota bacterium]|nr:hypothetical protein [Actinomycetota bacterium]
MSKTDDNPPGGEETKGDQPLRDLDEPDESGVHGGEKVYRGGPLKK